MLIIFSLITIIMLVAAMIWGTKNEWCDGLPVALSVIGAFLFLISLVTLIVGIGKTVKLNHIDEQITIYEEYNQEIEEDVSFLVDKYLAYEEGVFDNINVGELSGEKLLLITQLYPELKANTLIQSQIELYKENNNEIKRLKSSKVNLKLWRWWLCFK